MVDELTFDDGIGWWTNVDQRGRRMKHFYEYSIVSDYHRHSLCGRTHHVKNIIESNDEDNICKYCTKKLKT